MHRTHARTALATIKALALAAAIAVMSGCSTDLTVDASIHLTSGSAATLRFQPIPPVGTIRLQNTGPDRARLEFFGPSPDHPAMLDRLLTVDLGPGASRLESISGVQRIEATILGVETTTIVYTIRSRQGVGHIIDLGTGATATAGVKPAVPEETSTP